MQNQKGPRRCLISSGVCWMLSGVTGVLTTASTGQCLLSRFVHLASLACAQTAPPRSAGQALPVKPAFYGLKEIKVENKFFKTIDGKTLAQIFQVFNHDLYNHLKVHHYTRKESIFHILKSSILRMTHINKMNDPLEISFGIDVIKHILRKKSEYQHIIDFIDREIISTPINLPVFVFSTSADGDSHQQWINYSDAGRGISIEFDRKRLFRLIKNGMSNGQFAYIYPIQYYSDSFKISQDPIRGFEDLIWKYLNKLLRSDLDTQDTSYYEDVRSIIVLFASMIKNDFHQAEREWRFLLIAQEDDSNIEYLVHGNDIKPVYNQKLSDEFRKCVTGIMLGPNITNDIIAENDMFNLVKAKIDIGREKVTRSRGQIR
ncbi:Protein of unknown function [Alkalispirochaeta americana]|uniref:DUF2971 domain-containing protein n=1 Tax=Alkalispirochaeta americana TaxID=159291 RepID=A0A1N6Y255_9SPIO|nr:Protein of unknown function [Alkalispirochaeta americana]